MESIEQIIKTLSSFDLAKKSDCDIRNELKKIGKIYHFGLEINPGQFIIRSRCDREFMNYKMEEDISYIKDKSIIQKYNRASLEGESIFYGCIPNGNIKDDRLHQTLSVSEVSKLLDIESDEDLEEYATMGRWTVIKKFTVLVLAHHADYINKNQVLKDMNEAYLGFIKQYPTREKDFLKISEYLANEFAKPVTDEQRFLYKISSGYSKIAFDLGVQGIIYPSTKCDGMGFNIALLPSTVDNFLKLEKVAVWRIQKRKKNCLIIPFLYCDSFDDQKKFIWKIPDEIVPPWKAEEILSGK